MEMLAHMKKKMASHNKTEIAVTISKMLRKLCNVYAHSHKHWGVSIQNVLKKNLKTTTLDLLKALIIFNQCYFSFLHKFIWLLGSYLNTLVKSWHVFKLLYLSGMTCGNILQLSLPSPLRLALAELHRKGKKTLVLQNLMNLVKHCCTL